MSSYLWHKKGSFEIAKTPSAVLARTGSFDEVFRDFARSHLARWDGLERAWVFPAAKEAELLHGLEKMTAEKASATAQQAMDNSVLLLEMEAEPFSFHGPRLQIELDKPSLRFVVRFPYNEPLSQILRQAGGRWSPEIRSYTLPLSALQTLRSISEQPRLENELFTARNASFFAAEASTPLSAWMDAQQLVDGYHLVKIESKPLDMTYKITFPFAIDSILGQEIIRPPLWNTGVLDHVRPSDLDRMYPRVNLNSAVFEFSQRPSLENALSLIRQRLDSLGPYTKTEIENASMKGRRWTAERLDPQPGEMFLQDNKAWLIAKVQKTKNKTVLKTHPLSAKIAEDKITALSQSAKRRICDMSGIDFLALEPYVEALTLSEESRFKHREPPSAKKTRL